MAQRNTPQRTKDAVLDSMWRGEKYADVVHEYGVSSSRIVVWSKIVGIEGRYKKHKPWKPQHAPIERMQVLLVDGYSIWALLECLNRFGARRVLFELGYDSLNELPEYSQIQYDNTAPPYRQWSRKPDQ